MQRLSGVLLILAGAALGGYTYLPAPPNGAEKLAEVTRISAAPDRGVTGSIRQSLSTVARAEAATVADSPRVFSPATPLAPVPNDAAAAETSAQRSNATPWTAVVTTEPAAQMKKLSSPRPGDAETRVQLTSDLQRELTRVGCYGGEINGAWTQSTQRAMSAFMDRVNATLPTNEPDYILLTLVQGHATTACGVECPSGEIMAASGRCMPQAVVAQATKKSQRAEERRSAEALKAQQQERLAQEQRATEGQRLTEKSRLAAAERAVKASKTVEAAKLADAAKVAAAMKRADARKAADAKAQALAAVDPEKLPWLADDAAFSAKSPAAKPAEIAAVVPASREALPGMMSLSGPRSTEPEMPASVAAVTPDHGPMSQFAAASPTAAEDDLGAAPIIAPAPKKAVRPALRQAALTQQGLPGTKSGPAVRRAKISNGLTQGQTKYRAAKAVRRPPPVVAYAQPKKYYYASNYSSKPRRGQPRPGTMHYNLLQSLGGIY